MGYLEKQPCNVRKVKYYEYGILTRRVSKWSIDNNKEVWTFESDSFNADFIDPPSITIVFSNLSEENYELVCYSDEHGYIFRSAKKVEEILEEYPEEEEEETELGYPKKSDS